MALDARSRKRSTFDWRLPAAGLLVLLVAALAFWFWSTGARLERGRQALRQNALEGAERAFDRASRAWRGSARGYEGMALVHFLRGELAAGRESLDRAEQAGGTTLLLEAPEEMMEKLVRGGRSAAAAAWGAYLAPRTDRAPVLFWYAAALAGSQKPEEAAAALERFRVEAGAVGASPFEMELQILSREMRDLERGGHDCLLDRGGEPGHGWRLDTRDPVPGVWPLRSLTGRDPATADAGFLSERDLHNRVLLTLQREAQQAADSALRNYAGGFVLLDIETGELLAAVSHPPAREGEGEEGEEGEAEPPWTAFLEPYEPGSIVKLLTHAAALRSGADLSLLYPIDCKGNDWVLDGQIVYDWRPHGLVPDTTRATAVSCNTAFGKMGLLVGQASLRDEMLRWGFDREVRLPPARAALGRVWEDRLTGDLQVARVAMGLGRVRTTVLHAALLAATIAHDGVMPQPRLLLEKRSVMGDVYERSEPEVLLEPADPAICAQLREGMRATVRMPDGTGARLADARFPLAVKTGTAGTKEGGYDAILIGYFPIDRPRLAFGMILEGGGLAGVEGARVLENFLDSWASRGGADILRGATP